MASMWNHRARRRALLSLSVASLLLVAGAVHAQARSSKIYMGVEIRNRQGGGIHVVAVDPAGPAGKAGLLAGDVITAFGGVLFQGKGNDAAQLFGLLPKHGTAKPVPVRFQRRARSGKLFVHLGEKPFMGVAVAGHEGQGLRVQQVLPGTVAQEAGILPGDVIIGFDNEVWTATNMKPPTLISAVMGAPFDKAVKVALMRDGEIVYKVVVFRRGNPYVFAPAKPPSPAQRRAAVQGRRPGMPAVPPQTGLSPVMGGAVTPTKPAKPTPQSQPSVPAATPGEDG